MPLTTYETPLNISLAELQAGIQNQEDIGGELVDLSKGTSGPNFVNLVSFQLRTERLGTIQLISAPPGLFVKSADGYSVDPDVERPFLQHVTDSGLSVVLYCPILSIEGNDTSLAVARCPEPSAPNSVRDPTSPKYPARSTVHLQGGVSFVVSGSQFTAKIHLIGKTT